MKTEFTLIWPRRDFSGKWEMQWNFRKNCLWMLSKVSLASLVQSVIPKRFKRDTCQTFTQPKRLTLSGPAFSVVRQARGGGSEALMPKIKVNINWLKLNFAWVIISIKAFLMQNLRLIALLVLEIWRHKIFLKRRERVIWFDYLPPENGFNFKKKEFLCPESFFSTQNWTPMSISTIFKQRKIFSFSKFLGRLYDERAAATPLIDQFC